MSTPCLTSAADGSLVNVPLVTIVMPVYNRAEVVGRTLASIAAQTFRPFNVVLVDNNSTDQSLNVLTQWAERHSTDDMEVQVISELRPGAASARNAGLDLVDTPWVMFFDSDDTMAPNHLQRINEAITSGDADLYGWDIRINFIDGRSVVKPFTLHHTLYDCIQHGILSSQRYVCSTDMVREAGGWNRYVTTWDDIELGTRLLTKFPHLRVRKISGDVSVDVYESADSITGPTFHSRAMESELALDFIYDALPEEKRYIANLRRVILAGYYEVEGFDQDARALRARALSDTPSAWHRLLLRTAFAITASGHRGAAKILRPFFYPLTPETYESTALRRRKQLSP